MGNKGTKEKPKESIQTVSKNELSLSDYTYINAQTGFSKEEIKALFDKFNAKNGDGKLDKEEFVRLYTELRPEPQERMDQISKLIFKGFDADNNGYIIFKEFIVKKQLSLRF